MGTLRDGNLSSSGISSDPDISSSEQSCDTVIYMGISGKALSDRELTDNEGPPRIVPIPRRSSGSRSGGSSKGSGTEGSDRESSPSMSPFKSGASINSGRGSPIPQGKSAIPQPRSAMVQLPRRINIRTRPGPHPNKAADIMVQSQEQWIDGPGAAISQTNRELAGEWSASKAPECWVDGPGFHQGYVQTGVIPTPQIRPAEESADTPELRKKSNQEQWVDGPSAFRQNNETQPMWTERQPTESKPKICLPLKNKIITDLVEEELGPRPQPRSNNSTFCGSNSSLSVQADSQAVSSSSGESNEATVAKDSENLEKVEKMPVKAFVKDWVEKHSEVTTGVEDQLTIKTDLFTYLPPGEHKETPESTSDVLQQLQKDKDNSGISSSQSSPIVKRALSDNNSQASPGSRTAQWIKSVQKDHALEKSKKLSESIESLISEHPECDQAIISDSIQSLNKIGDPVDIPKNKPPEETVSAPDLTELKDKGSKDWLTVQSALTQKSGKMSNLCDILDSSFESDTNKEALSKDGESHNFVHLLNTNRESIYELTMDERLESDSMHRGESCQVYNNSTDDSFSDLSLPKDLCSETKENLGISCDVDDITYETLEPGSSSVCYGSSQGVPLMDVNANPMNTVNQSVPVVSVTEPSEQDFLLEDTALPNSIQLRKPDGASDPNIHYEHVKEVHYEILEEIKCKKPCEHKAKPVKGRLVVGQLNQDNSQVASSVPVASKQIPFLANTAGKNSVPLNSPSKSAKPVPPPRTTSQQSPPGNKTMTGAGSLQPRPGRARSSKGTNQSSMAPNSITNVPSSRTPPAKSSPAKSSPSKLPFFSSRSKSQPSPSKSPTKELKHSSSDKKEKVKKESKRSKSESSPSPSPNKKVSIKKDSKNESKSPFMWKKHESKLPVKSGSKSDDNASPRRTIMSDSDSGNDSGISRSSRKSNNKRLLSPYATVTKPRSSSHSSSGLGSDNSSMCSGSPSGKWGTSKNGKKSVQIHGGTSSGYESMIRDSEGSPNDSTSESSSGGRSKSPKSLKKKASGKVLLHFYCIHSCMQVLGKFCRNLS